MIETCGHLNSPKSVTSYMNALHTGTEQTQIVMYLVSLSTSASPASDEKAPTK